MLRVVGTSYKKTENVNRGQSIYIQDNKQY